MFENQKISALLYKLMREELTAKEEACLTEWRQQDDANQYIYDEVTKGENIENVLKGYHPKNREMIKSAIWSKVVTLLPEVRRKSLYRTRMQWLRIAAAAILTIGIAGFFLGRESRPQREVAQVVADVKAPLKNKAMITLANGQKVLLDSLLSGTLAVQGGEKLVKLANGQLVYQGTAADIATATMYNTLENPKGSKVIDMVFSDGSHIWLNAGSVVTFPVIFKGNQRKISLLGEAYLDVVHNTSMPFIVDAGNINVEVLGTGFNVNAYKDESDTKITLVNGSVKLYNSKGVHTLKPGQQARVGKDVKIGSADLDVVMAWKENKFLFKNNRIQDIMRQLEKWYNIEVVYEGAITNEEFVGSISRDVNLSQILNLLSETKAVSFELVGNTVIVK